MPAFESNGSTLIKSFHRHATRSGQTLFCDFYTESGCETIDFDMLFGRAGAYAAEYRSRGLAPGDTIFIVLRHRPDLLYAFVGAILAGCVPAFLAPMSEKQDPALYWAMLAELFATVGARAAIVEAEDLEAMSATAAPHAMRVGSLVPGRVRVEDIVWPSPTTRRHRLPPVQLRNDGPAQRRHAHTPHRHGADRNLRPHSCDSGLPTASPVGCPSTTTWA